MRTAALLLCGIIGAAYACFEDFECEYDHLDKFGVSYSFNFKPLCRDSSHYFAADSQKASHYYYFNVCGNSNMKCLPEYSNYYEYGIATQNWGNAPSCNSTNMCTSLTSGNPECCTAPCEVLGVGRPTIDVIDENAPITGGVIMTFQSVPEVSTDGNQCPIDPKTGSPMPRKISYIMYCDKTVPRSDRLAVVYAKENTTCHYVIAFRSPFACGCEPQCFGKTCGDDGCGGFCGSPHNEGECPVNQICNSKGLCCRADCVGRTCGPDGCGGYCGSCPEGSDCNWYGTCGEPEVLTAQSGASGSSIAGAFFGGLFSTVAVGAVGLFCYKRRSGAGFSGPFAPSASRFSSSTAGVSSSSSSSTPAKSDYGAL